MKEFFKNFSKYARSPNLFLFWEFSILGIAVSIVYIAFPKSAIFLYIWIVVFFSLLAAFLKTSIERVLYKDQIIIQNENLSSLIDHLDDAVVLYDKDFKIIIINPAAERLFSLSKKMIEGTRIGPASVKNKQLKLLTETLFPSLAPGARQTSETGTWPNIIELSFENPRLELTTILNRITNKDGAVIEFMKVIRDKTREFSLLKTKNEFIDVAAHQLRTPLTAIHWTFEGIVNASETYPEIQQLAREGLGVSERSLKITNDLLDASKIEDGRFGYNFQKTNIINLINTVVKEMSGIAKEYSVRITNSSEIQQPDVFIDENSIGMVLFNLIDNAIRYNTKNGEVFITTQRTLDEKFVKISIKDTGVGIQEDELPKIFEKLHRGSNIIRMEPNGTGLGLYIAKNIIKRHGGEMGVESTLNRGSAFWFTIPTEKGLNPFRSPDQL